MSTIALLSVVLNIASAEPQGQSTLQVSLWLDGTERAAMVPSHEPYTGAPAIGAPARAARPNAHPRAEWFIVRSWTQGDKVRVVVFARDRQRNETQIASALLEKGASWEVTATERYGAVPVTVILIEREPQ